jgi:hypothetical protein
VKLARRRGRAVLEDSTQSRQWDTAGIVAPQYVIGLAMMLGRGGYRLAMHGEARDLRTTRKEPASAGRHRFPADRAEREIRCTYFSQFTWEDEDVRLRQLAQTVGAHGPGWRSCRCDGIPHQVLRPMPVLCTTGWRYRSVSRHVMPQQLRLRAPVRIHRQRCSPPCRVYPAPDRDSIP